MNQKPSDRPIYAPAAHRRESFVSQLRAWLPSRGNVLFTLLVVVSLVWATKAGAVSLGAPARTGVSNSTIAYQGRLADSSGSPLNGTYAMVFRFYSSSTGGSALWEEDWTGANSVQVSNGLFNVMLGSLNAIPQSLISGNDGLWLGVTVGTDSEMTPRVQIGSVPYAFRANQADRAFGLSAPAGGPADALTVDSSGNIGIGAASAAAKLEIDGQNSLLRLWNPDPNTVANGEVDLGVGNTNAAGGNQNNWISLRSIGDGNTGILNSNQGGDSLPLSRADVIHADGESMIFANYLQKPFYFIQGAGGAGGPSHIPLTISGNGNVGVGTTSPDATLQVNGTVKLLGTWDSSKNVGSTYTAPSDGFVVTSLTCVGGPFLEVGGINGSDMVWGSNDAGRAVALTMPVRKGDSWYISVHDDEGYSGPDPCNATNIQGNLFYIPFGN